MYSKDPLIPFPKRPRKDIYEPGEILRDLLEVQNIQVQPKFEQLGPPPSYMGAVKQYLSDINNRLKDSKTELDILKNDQRSIRQFQPQLIGHFFERQDLLINNLSALQRELDQLTLNQILDAECTLSKAKIEEQIDKYLAEVMVHKNYLRFLSTPGAVQISELFCLQIEEQPLPLPITQKQNLSFQVSLLSAPGIPLRLSNPTVTAKFEIVEGQADGDSSKVNKINKKISGGTANLDSKDSSGYYKASFKKLSLDSPSHMKLIQFSFICTVEVILDSGSRMVAIESRPTYPYVIMANQKQWPQAEKSMFRAMNLSEQNLPWVKFCNLLHLHYLRVLLSANISEKDLRTLSLREFAFFKQKMFSVFERNNTPCEVQVSHFDKFWDWFGFVLRQLRYNKQIAQLWRRGYIFGFINKSEVEIILRQFAHTHGNPFIIRFSTTSAAGDITVGLYVTVEQQVHHIVVQPKRILSGLADYICTLDSLEFLVTTKTYFAIENLDQCGATPELKDNSIGQILDTNITKLIGYDDSMPSRSPQLQPFTNPVSTMPTPQPNLPMHNTQDVRHLVPPNVEPPRINIDFEYNILAPRDDYEWLNFETD